MKPNTGSNPVAYDIFLKNSIIDIVTFEYGIFPHTVLLNMWFVSLIGWFGEK